VNQNPAHIAINGNVNSDCEYASATYGAATPCEPRDNVLLFCDDLDLSGASAPA